MQKRIFFRNTQTLILNRLNSEFKCKNFYIDSIIHGNSEIVSDLEKAGINTKEWLNYEETKEFTLSSAEGSISFAEPVQMPLNRIKETLGAYTLKIKEVLKQYLPELQKAEIT